MSGNMSKTNFEVSKIIIRSNTYVSVFQSTSSTSTASNCKLTLCLEMSVLIETVQKVDVFIIYNKICALKTAFLKTTV